MLHRRRRRTTMNPQPLGASRQHGGDQVRRLPGTRRTHRVADDRGRNRRQADQQMSAQSSVFRDAADLCDQDSPSSALEICRRGTDLCGQFTFARHRPTSQVIIHPSGNDRRYRQGGTSDGQAKNGTCGDRNKRLWHEKAHHQCAHQNKCRRSRVTASGQHALCDGRRVPAE